MSYIRCLSNPEGLYIWSDGKTMHFSIGPDIKTVPNVQFQTFMTLYLKNLHTKHDFKWGKLSIKEVYIPHKKRLTKFDKMLKHKPGSFKYELRYNGQLIARMWYVTWKYIMDNFKRERA